MIGIDLHGLLCNNMRFYLDKVLQGAYPITGSHDFETYNYNIY